MLIEELGDRCPAFPPGFVALQLEDVILKKSQVKLHRLYSDIVKELNIAGSMQNKLRTDIELIVEAGYYAGSALENQISAEDYLLGIVVFASANYHAIHRLVGTKEKRDVVEK